MPSDTLIRAAEIESLVRGLLGRPRTLSQAVRAVFDNMPKDGTILAYMNHQRLEMLALFDSVLDELRDARELARECVAGGQQVPSLPALDKALSDAERIRAGALDHWIEFDPNQQIGPREDYIPDDQAFLDIEARLSPEARREPQSRLEQIRR